MKLFLLSSGKGRVPKGLFAKGQGFKSVEFPILVFLIQKDDNYILFDTGSSTNFYDETRPLRYRQNWFFSKFVMQTNFEPSRDAIINQIKKLGISPDNITHIILSHLHWDHAGGIKDFPNATFIITRTEWEAANKWWSFLKAYIAEQYNLPDIKIKCIETDSSMPVLLFPSSYDIFGDSSMILVDLPGHTAGLAGLLITMPSGRKFFLIGDSSYFPEGYEHNIPKSRLMKILTIEGKAAEQTVKQINRVYTDYPDIEIIGAHDYRIPGRYELAPAYYE